MYNTGAYILKNFLFYICTACISGYMGIYCLKNPKEDHSTPGTGLQVAVRCHVGSGN